MMKGVLVGYKKGCRLMRKLIVSNICSLDGYYEGKDRNLNALFDYFHEDYQGDQNFDTYMVERMRAADTLLLSGRAQEGDLNDVSHYKG